MSGGGEPTERKVVLVTAGAGAGIGSAVVRELAEANWDVVVTDAHERRCLALGRELEDVHGRPFLALPLDVTDYEAVERVVNEAIARLGRLDALVNNAGWNRIEPIAEMRTETWDRCLAVDLTGTFYCMRQALRQMIEQQSGAIVNVASIAAWEASESHGGAYSAAKAGVMALTRVAAAEVGRYGIRVNAVAPGLIYNRFLERIYTSDFFASYADERTFVGRVGEPRDVAGLIAFLLSDRASYITGEVYGISGGTCPHA